MSGKNWFTGEGYIWGGDGTAQYNAPSYVTDPNYTAATNSLMPFASSLISGKGLPDAYAGLITPNSPQFQQMLQRTTGNVLGATEDQLAGQGIGGSGVAASAAAGAVGNATSQLTWQDFLNSQSNQLQLLGLGTSTLQGIASNGLNNANSENQFNLTNAAEATGTQLQNINLQNQAQANFGQLLGSTINASANAYGYSKLQQ